MGSNLHRTALAVLVALPSLVTLSAACQIVDGLGSVVFEEGGAQDARPEAASDAACSFDGEASLTRMVLVPVVGGAVCIDRTEVTLEQWKQLDLDADVPDGSLGLCGLFGRASIGSKAPCGAPTDPVTMVPYCGAVLYCAAHGETLCPAADWIEACRGAKGTLYPYGQDFNANECNVSGAAPGPVPWDGGSCEGAYPGVFDLVGNVAEWTVNCAMSGDSVSCAVLGGSYETGRMATCPNPTLSLKRYYESIEKTDPAIGFRCCAATLADGGCPH
jgi:formylglycine-generating enzyme required for sulfatase activity